MKTRRRLYKTIVVDPPWPGPNHTPTFKSKTPHPHVVLPYETMSGFQIAGLRVRDLATPDAQLFLWATSRTLGDAFLCLQTWAFRFRGLFVWDKGCLGLGRHVRNQCEFLIWGGREGAPLVKPTDCPHQVQRWKNPRGHSVKPAAAYEFIRSLSQAPRLDLFSRQTRPGFDAWGNESPAAA